MTNVRFEADDSLFSVFTVPDNTQFLRGFETQLWNWSKKLNPDLIPFKVHLWQGKEVWRSGLSFFTTTIHLQFVHLKKWTKIIFKKTYPSPAKIYFVENVTGFQTVDIIFEYEKCWLMTLLDMAVSECKT